MSNVRFGAQVWQEHPQPPAEPGPREQTVLNIFSILIALYAVYEALGISYFFTVTNKSNDDAELAMEEKAWELLFDPVGFVILLSLLAAAFALHTRSKKLPRFSNTTTRAGLITVVVCFVLSLFRVSIIFPVIFHGLGMMTNQVNNGSDERAPAAEEFVLDPAQLIQYHGAPGVRAATALTNNSGDHWQHATVAVTFTDAAGTVCAGHEQSEDFIAPGQQRALVTDFLTAAVYYSDPSCVPVTATANLVTIDIDSRSEVIPADYERTAPVFLSLTPFEEPGLGDGVVTLSIAGVLSPESMNTVSEDTGLPVGFEVADQQGVRLDWCFKTDEVAADGTFITRSYHSPIAPGEFPAVVVLPTQC